MYIYRNTHHHGFTVLGIGFIEEGAVFESAKELIHPWLERVEKEKPAKNTQKDT